MKYQDRIKLMNEIQNELEAVTKTASDFNNEEHFDVMTEEGYVNQLNRLYSKGTIDKEYYLEQVGIMKNNYPNSYELIKNKLLMN